jgi:hypothetical protein
MVLLIDNSAQRAALPQAYLYANGGGGYGVAVGIARHSTVAEGIRRGLGKYGCGNGEQQAKGGEKLFHISVVLSVLLFLFLVQVY